MVTYRIFNTSVFAAVMCEKFATWHETKGNDARKKGSETEETQ